MSKGDAIQRKVFQWKLACVLRRCPLGQGDEGAMKLEEFIQSISREIRTKEIRKIQESAE